MQQQQRTEYVLAQRGQYGGLEVVDRESGAEVSADVQRVEVLRDVDWLHMENLVIPACRDVNVRSRLLLRSLSLSQQDSNRSSAGLLFDFQAVLDSLPRLASLRCSNIGYISIAALLDIASHSTLEELHIDSGPHSMADSEWIGYVMRFPIGAAEDERRLEEVAAHSSLDGDIEEEDSEAVEAALVGHESESDNDSTCSALDHGERLRRGEMQRMRTALTRTQPTEQSCRVRLALADWLHRRLRRGGLLTDDLVAWANSVPRHPKSLLRHYRMQVALLRSTLQRQLDELALSAEAAPCDLHSTELSSARQRVRADG